MSKQPAKAPCLSTTKAGWPCSFTTKAGRLCRAWAVRGSEPPACSSHLRSGSGERTKEQACSSHLRSSSSHLRASSSGNAQGQARSNQLLSVRAEDTREAGFYGHTLSDEELADLVIYAAELSLDDEIACTRIAVRRTLEFLNQRLGSLSETEYLRAAGLVFQGTRTIARLLREQQALSGGSDNRLQAIFDAALDGLSEEWGIEL
jgi:hypothetical protein